MQVTVGSFGGVLGGTRRLYWIPAGARCHGLRVPPPPHQVPPPKAEAEGKKKESSGLTMWDRALDGLLAMGAASRLYLCTFLKKAPPSPAVVGRLLFFLAAKQETVQLPAWVSTISSISRTTCCLGLGSWLMRSSCCWMRGVGPVRALGFPS